MPRITAWTLRAILGLTLLTLLTLLSLRGLVFLRETQDGTPPAEGRLVQTAMGAIYVEESGPADGRPLLLAHGSVGWSRMWKPTLDVLAAHGYRAIAFDMPPMGFSERDPAADYSRQAQAKRIVALAESLGIKPFLIAHSFGAGAAAEAAMTSPQVFSGLVVVSGAIGLNPDPSVTGLPIYLRPMPIRQLLVSATATNPYLTATLLKAFLYRKGGVTPELITILQAPFLRKGTTAELARWLPALLVPPKDALSTTPQNWQSLVVPVAFVWGDKDSVTPLPQGQALADLTGEKLFLLSDVGHIPQIEAPDAFHASLLAALAALRP